jgi:nucleolar protein 53
VQKTLKIDQILASRSAVPACGNKRPSTSQIASKAALRHSDSQTTKRQLRKALRTAHLKKSNSDALTDATPKDPWAAGDADSASHKPSLDFISDILPKPVKAPLTMKMIPVAVKTIPAVETVHPGASYNPLPDQHRELIQQAVKVELVKAKREEELAENGPSKAVLLKLQQVEPTSTMDCDLDDDDDDENNSGGSYDKNVAEIAAATTTGKTRRKTQAERNRQERERQQQMERQREKQQAEKERELNRLSHLQRQLNESTKQQQQRRQERKQQNAQQLAPPRLSRHAYQSLPIAVQLTEELAGSLRELKPESNLFKERFNMLQKRGVVETRLPISVKRRYQKKEFEKHSYKNFK